MTGGAPLDLAWYAGSICAAPAVGSASIGVWPLLALAAPLLWYGVGLYRLWRSAGPGRGVGFGAAAAFLAGWLTLLLAFASPFHALAGRSFAAHMGLHLLLMAVAAPLLILARPLAPLAWALPMAARLALLRPAARGWRRLADPVLATALQMAVLTAWHLPRAFDRAVGDPFVHAAQHLTLALTALLFWWVVLERGRAGRSHGLIALCLFATMLHGTALGALLTLAPRPLYAGGVRATPLDSLADQQLGGLLMWVPGGLIYAVAALVLLTRCVRGSGPSVDWLKLAPRHLQ